MSDLLWNQQHLASCFASGKRFVSLRCVLQRELEFCAELQLPRCDPSEKIVRALFELRTRGRIGGKGRTRQEQRPALREQLRIERGDRAARLSEQRHHAARCEA